MEYNWEWQVQFLENDSKGKGIPSLRPPWLEFRLESLGSSDLGPWGGSYSLRMVAAQDKGPGILVYGGGNGPLSLSTPLWFVFWPLHLNQVLSEMGSQGWILERFASYAITHRTWLCWWWSHPWDQFKPGSDAATLILEISLAVLRG